jgi:hypothetical protein
MVMAMAKTPSARVRRRSNPLVLPLSAKPTSSRQILLTPYTTSVHEKRMRPSGDTTPILGRTLASSKLAKGAGQNASGLSVNLVNIFKVWYSANRGNGLFMGLGKREADKGSSCRGRVRLGGEGDGRPFGPSAWWWKAAIRRSLRARTRKVGFQAPRKPKIGKVRVGCGGNFKALKAGLQDASACLTETGPKSTAIPCKEQGFQYNLRGTEKPPVVPVTVV